MDYHSLQERIAERKAEALRKGFITRAAIIVRGLGDSYFYRQGDLTVTSYVHDIYGYGAVTTLVIVGGGFVFNATGSNVTKYIPGPWEKEFDTLYEQGVAAMKVKEQKQVEARETKTEAELKAEAANWGLD